ncbi:MAG: hypothetical protein OXG46_06040 [Chloroflexi bacterium]|nr:hypothetical protein [Chloroflexota bacterium]
MTANDLMIVIRARDEAAKALASVQGQLGLIVEAAQAANDAIAQIAETAAPAVDAAQKAVAAAQSAAPAAISAPPPIDTQGMAAAVQSMSDGMGQISAHKDAIGGFGETIGMVAGKVGELLTSLGGLNGGVEALKNIFSLFSKDTQGAGNALNMLAAGPVTNAGGGLNNLGGSANTSRGAFSGLSATLSKLASGAFTRLAALGATLIPVIRGVGAALMTVAMNPVGMIVMALTGLVAAGIAIWKNWDTISAKATEIWNTISGFLGGAMENITGMFSEAWNGITSFFSGMWEGLIGIFTDNWQTILGIIFPAAGLAMLIAENWGAITEKVSEIWGAVVETVTEWWNNLMGILFPEEGGLFVRFQELFSLVMTWFDENVLAFFTGLPERIGELVSGIADVVSAPFRLAFGAVRGFINRIVDAVNDLPSIEVPNLVPIIGGQTFSLPKLPRIPDFEFAEGGILRRPIVALAEREPEVIAPLSALGRMLPAGAGGPPVIQIVNRGTIVTERQLERVIVKAYHRAVRLGRI